MVAATFGALTARPAFLIGLSLAGPVAAVAAAGLTVFSQPGLSRDRCQSLQAPRC